MSKVIINDQEVDCFITTYLPIAGHKAVMLCWDDKYKQYFPEQTGYFAFATKEEAIKDAQIWATAEEIPYLAE